MKELGFDDGDQFVQMLLHNYDAAEVYDYDDLDAETRAAIEEAERQIDAGQDVPWEEVRAELLAKYKAA